MTKRCEETVISNGQPQMCDRPLDDHGYCDRPMSHVEPCPWCGADVWEQGGLEAHISEPCDEYLAEMNGEGKTCRNCDAPIDWGYDFCQSCMVLTDGGRQMRPPADDN